MSVMSNRADADFVEHLRANVQGPRAAAWIVWRHRYQFRLAGGIDFFVSRETRIPRWFAYALAVFKARASWDVRQLSSKEGTTYMIRWLGARRWQVEGTGRLWQPGRSLDA